MTAAIGLRSSRGPILMAIMLATGVVAANATMVATAVPTIVADLGGFELFPWLFTVFVLAQAITTPLAGKLSDSVGRRPVIFGGLTLFLLASIGAGLAWDMTSLIAFRLVQGFAAGAIQPIAITILGDIYSVVERAKVQAYIGSVWVIASVAGPVSAGLLVEFVSWRWVFFINVPLCLLTAWMLARGFHESIERRRRRIDVLGATLLAVSVACLLIGVLQGGISWPWLSWQTAALVSGFIVFAIVFVVVEQRVPEPVVPMWVFTRRLLLSTTLLSLGVGALFLGLTSFVPTYLVAALDAPPILAGLAVSMISIGWPVAAANSGRVYLRWGYRAAALSGTCLLLIGTSTLALSVLSPSIPIVALGSLFVGGGLGLVAIPGLIAAQSSVEWGERGVVSGMNLFARSLGAALGVALLGAIANASLAASDAPESPGAIADAAQSVFITAIVIALFAGAAALLMPRTGAPDGAHDAPDS